MASVDAGWSSLVARRAHNPKVVGSNPAPATTLLEPHLWGFLLCLIGYCANLSHFTDLGVCALFLFVNTMMQNELVQLLAPTVSAMGYELWGCEYLSQGKHSLLRIYIDKPDGIGIEDCQEVSKQISALLDVEDPIPGNYSLEISSPGIPRPLFSDWQYQRYVGQPVQVKTFKPVNGKRKLLGTIVSSSESAVVLDINNEHHEILFSNIVKAYLTV